ncbi:30S ribosomal protein S16 [Candidatus Roizmanbacteria bacterium]|nr:30S ribosomal protein S16 [Candidatus Roizmanbacteria bacterium]
MAAALRLMRLGKRGKPFYRIVVIDKKRKRNSKYIDKLGTYDPLSEQAEIQLDKQKFEYWVERGAVISEGLRRLLKKRKRVKMG